MTRNISLLLVGFGNVGQALARLLLKKQEFLEKTCHCKVAITGIATGRHGMAIDPNGIDLHKALELAQKKLSLNVLSTQPVPSSVLDLIAKCPADVLFEISPVNSASGQPAIDHLRSALEHGMHAITANKGPVAHAYTELRDLAVSKNRRFLFESTVMDGAPIFSLFRETLAGAELHGFHGILNSTTNLILDHMETGESYEEAVAYAQSIGIAETDPSADVDGWDAAIKVSVLATVLMGVALKPQQIEREGIRSITPEMIAAAKQAGSRWKLVCRVKKQEDGTLQSRVAPEQVPPTSPLYSVSGTSSFIQFESDVLPGLGILEGNPSPETTAFGLFADFIKAVS